MLMDEPLSALDSQTRELLMDDSSSCGLRERFSACYVTHNLAEAVRLGHRSSCCRAGRGASAKSWRSTCRSNERAERMAELDPMQRHLWQ